MVHPGTTPEQPVVDKGTHPSPSPEGVQCQRCGGPAEAPPLCQECANYLVAEEEYQDRERQEMEYQWQRENPNG